MDKKNVKIFLVLASIGIFLFACLTSVITINFYNQRMQCLYSGITYNNGDTFLSSDKCNTCSCLNGSVACTLKACANQFVGTTPMKGLEIYCYKNNSKLLYSILPGTNRTKSFNEVTGESQMMSYPVKYYTNKTRPEALQILLKEYGYNNTTALYALDNCTSAEKLK